MQVAAFSTPNRPDWRWRIVNYAGEVIEESERTFPTISSAVADGARRMAQINVPDRSIPRSVYRPASRPQQR